jgi:tellurite methyltransferase
MKDKGKWETYYEATKTNPPSVVAMNAMKEVGDKKGLVIDLGCGAGMDSLYFLRNGWEVLAIDSSPEFLIANRSKIPEELQQRLIIEKMHFEELTLPKADCIIANFSLPFCNPKQFNDMWSKIVKQIKIGGIFSGIFFGNRDEWASEFAMERTFHTKEEVMNLFDQFEIINLKELEYEGKCCGRNGKAFPKHWHYFQVVSRRKMVTISLLPYTKERVHEFYKEYIPDAMIFSKDDDITPFVYREDKVERYYETKVLDPSRRYFAICLGIKVIGEIQLKYIDFEKKCATLSIILANDSVKGYGYGTQAEYVLLNYAFEELGLDIVYADAVHRNKRSQHVLGKLGFIFSHEDELLRYYEIHKGDFHFTMTKD